MSLSQRVKVAVVTAALFLGCILAANYVTSTLGFVPVGFGLMATAGTYFAGLAFVLRDTLQDLAGKWGVLAVIAAGAVLSFAVASPAIALASAVAFAVSETVDLTVYTPLRDKGYLRAAVASNAAGAAVDTVLFLWVAGFPIWSSFGGQMVGKLAITLAVVVVVGTARAVYYANPCGPDVVTAMLDGPIAIIDQPNQSKVAPVEAAAHAGGRRCPNEATMRVIVGCTHEHIREVGRCTSCHARINPLKHRCRPCKLAGCDCKLIVLRVTDLREVAQ